MQLTHRPTAAVVVDAAATVPEEPTEEPTGSRGPVRLEVPKLTAATTCHFPSIFTVDLASDLTNDLATAERSVGPYSVDAGANHIMLPGCSHSRLGLSFHKEAKAGRMRD